jgi:hypothetical protein
MIDPNNDADMLTLDMQAAAQDAANGVCSLCDEALNPYDPKWGMSTRDADSVRACYGEPHADLPMYHRLCLEDR